MTKSGREMISQREQEEARSGITYVLCLFSFNTFVRVPLGPLHLQHLAFPSVQQSQASQPPDPLSFHQALRARYSLLSSLSTSSSQPRRRSPTKRRRRNVRVPRGRQEVGPRWTTKRGERKERRCHARFGRSDGGIRRAEGRSTGCVHAVAARRFFLVAG
jgi:hypothetical protein